MNREDILKLSREENIGRDGEYENSVYNIAALVSRTVGIFLCGLIVVACYIWDEYKPFAQVACFIYFAMEGSYDLVIYDQTHKRSKLIWGALKVFCACIFAIGIIVVMWRG